MSHDEKPRQPKISLRLIVEKNSSKQIAPPHRQQNSRTPEFDRTTTSMFASPRITPTDWKLRYDNLQYEHQLELERLRLHYEHQLREKVTEIRIQLKRDHEQQLAELRSTLFDQYQQQLNNLSGTTFGLDNSFGERVREQVRLAQEFDRDDDERRQLLQQTTDHEELKRLVNKLHTEGVHVLTLSELLALRLNGVNIGVTEESIATLQKLNEENSLLRSLIAKMHDNENGTQLIKCLADIFRCEQDRRMIQIRQHPNFEQLEQDIQDMCSYQRDALAKLFAQDRLSLIQELDQTKQQLNEIRSNTENFKTNSNKFYWKFLRSDNYRKSLIYQKRYLLVLLTGYEDTEIYALNEIRRLTGETPWNSTPLPYNTQRMKFVPKQIYHRRASNYRFRFRSYGRVVIAIIRMRSLAKKWARKSLTMK